MTHAQANTRATVHIWIKIYFRQQGHVESVYKHLI